jgi:hypothetical protein
MLHKFQFDTCLVFSCDPVYLSQGTDCMYVGIADLRRHVETQTEVRRRIYMYYISMPQGVFFVIVVS